MSTIIKNQPMKWHGGKSYLAKWIHSHAPPSVIDDPENGYTHRNITNFGCGGEFWNWLPIEGISEAVNDINGALINFWKTLRSDMDFNRFQRLASTIPMSQECWKGAIHESEWHPDKIKWAVAFFVRYRQSRQGLGKDYATPTRRTRRGMNENVSAWLSAVEGLPECHERLKRVEIRNMDAIDFIAKYDHPRALFYLDPPYLHETRSSTGEYGEHEMSPRQHIILLARLSHDDRVLWSEESWEHVLGEETYEDYLSAIEADFAGKFMLSGYLSTIYENFRVINGWTRHEQEIDNKASSKKKKEKKTECLWTNY